MENKSRSEGQPSADQSQAKPKKKKNFSSKSKNFPVRFKLAEIEDFKKEAGKLGITPTAYLRSRIYGTKVSVITIDVTFSKMLFELNKVGVNLNQIAHKVNQNQVSNTYFEDELINVTAKIKVLLGEIKERLK